MFKAHSQYPLHLAIQHQREDVVFMFIIEHNSDVSSSLSLPPPPSPSSSSSSLSLLLLLLLFPTSFLPPSSSSFSPFPSSPLSPFLFLSIPHNHQEDILKIIMPPFFSLLQLPRKLDELDDRGTIPLNLALINKNEGIANTLVSNRCNLDVTDRNGNTLLHLAIARGDVFAATFLIKSGASTILCKKEGQATPLHLVAQYNRAEAERYILSRVIKGAGAPADDLVEIGSLLLQYHANLDAQDDQGCTPLHRAVEAGNSAIFEIFLGHQT